MCRGFLATVSSLLHLSPFPNHLLDCHMFTSSQPGSVPFPFPFLPFQVHATHALLCTSCVPFSKAMTITDELNPSKGSPLGMQLILPKDQWRHVMDLRADRFNSLPDRWLEAQTVEALLLPTTLTAIGDGVLNNVEGLERVDLSHTAVRTIGSAFLAHSLSVTSVRFPPTLEALGHSCLKFTSIKRVDLSATRVTRLPTAFLFAAPAEVVLLPASLICIGDHAFRFSHDWTSVTLCSTHLGQVSLQSVLWKKYCCPHRSTILAPLVFPTRC
jgi:hypothetical protein